MYDNSRPISWIKAAQKDFIQFPVVVQERMSRALEVIAEGRKPDIVKPLKGFGSGVFQIALRYRTDAYRIVFALRIGTEIWVIHAFQK